MWNLHLIISVIFCQIEYIKNKTVEIKLYDKLYFDPSIATLMIYFMDKNYFLTYFDWFAWIMIFSFYYINFYYSIHLYKFSSFQISSINNIYLPENSRMMLKIRLNGIFLIFMNLIFTMAVKNFIFEETYFVFRFLIFFKVSNCFLFLGNIFST